MMKLKLRYRRKAIMVYSRIFVVKDRSNPTLRETEEIPLQVSLYKTARASRR